MDDDAIPTGEVYRDVPIHAGQNAKRRAIVRKAVDAVHTLTDLAELFAFLDDVREPPEARTLAGRKILDAFNDTSSSRQSRPRGVDLRTVEGIVGALSSNRWRSPSSYGSLLEPAAGQVQR